LFKLSFKTGIELLADLADEYSIEFDELSFEDD
jgi:hypothetical protein